MVPDLALKYEARAFDEEDSRLASAFRSGQLSYDSYINQPKYRGENILAATILSNSLLQIGRNWARYVPFAFQARMAPKSTDNLTLLSLSCLLNQAIHVSASLKSNDLIGMMKPSILLPPPDAHLTGLKRDSLNGATPLNHNLVSRSPPGHFVPQHFDFNARVAPYLDSLVDYPAELTSPAKKRLHQSTPPSQPSFDSKISFSPSLTF